MAGDTHIPPAELKAAVLADREMNQVATKMHQELAVHDGAALRQTIGQIKADNMPLAVGNYEALFGKPFGKAIAEDKSLPSETKSFVAERLNSQGSKPNPSERGEYPANLFNGMSQLQALTWLDGSQFQLTLERLKVKTAAYSDSSALQMIPFLRSETEDSRTTAQNFKDAEEQLRKTLTSYSPSELKAVQDYSITHSKVPGKGILDELASDNDFTPQTKHFIAALLAQTKRVSY